MPCDRSSLRAEVAQRPNYLVELTLNLEPAVESALAAVLTKEIELNRNMEEMKQTIDCEK